MKNADFVSRLRIAFGDDTAADVARRLSLPHATVNNYFHGRMPSPEVLILITDETNVSLTWLLTGRGEQYIGDPAPADIGRVLQTLIANIVDERLSKSREMPDTAVYDLRQAIAEMNDPQKILKAWCAHDGFKVPKDFGVVFFQGWETMSDDEKADAIRDARRVIERNQRHSS